MKHFNTNVDNNDVDNNSNDETYDGKIRDKIVILGWYLVNWGI